MPTWLKKKGFCALRLSLTIISYIIDLILSQLLKKKWPRFIWFMNFVKLF